MTSSADVEIGDDIWITDHQHPYYGKAGKVITVGKELIGVRPNGSTSAVGIHLKVGQFVKVTFHKDWHKNEPAVRSNPDYELPFSPPAHFTAVPFQLSDSAIEWADGQRAARIDNIKKTVAFLQQEIERLETNAVTFKVEHNAPERTYNFAKDTVEGGRKKDEPESDDKEPEEDGGRNRRLHLTNAVWGLVEHQRLQNALLEWICIQDWMTGRDLPTFMINIHNPWWIKIDSHGVERLLSLEEREEVIDMIQGDSK